MQTEAKTPATILPDSEATTRVNCKDCGEQIATLVPDWLAKWPTLCDKCACAQAIADQARIKTEAEAAQLSEWQRICPPDFREIDPSKLPNPKMLERVLRWPYGPRGLVLHGKTGRGKSRCAWQLLKREYQRGRSIAVMDHAAAYDYAAKFDRSTTDAARWVESMSKIGLLFLDDVFKAKFTDSFEQALFTIISSRCEHRLPIILTTNDVGESLTQRMTSDRGSAMVRRLRDHAEAIAFV